VLALPAFFPDESFLQALSGAGGLVGIKGRKYPYFRLMLHKPILTKGIYFITFTCHKWLSLIDKTNCYDSIYKWFDILKKRNHEVLAYVVMPNHLHLLLYYSGGNRSLNFEIGEAKRFIAYEIINRLKKSGEERLLHDLNIAVQTKDRDRGKLHEVWKDSFDCKECRTEKFIMQKLQYIHNNPCNGKWKLADDPLHYPYSSASFYISGKKGLYGIRDYREILVQLVEEADNLNADESSGLPQNHAV
jgi:REP element-mobilizing transposase RayT